MIEAEEDNKFKDEKAEEDWWRIAALGLEESGLVFFLVRDV